MPTDDGINMIIKAHEKKVEDRVFQLYTAKYAWMTEKDFIPFEKFYQPHRQQAEQKSDGEILEEVREVLNAFKAGEAHGNI